jgi:eukaryotic-like serine/threonine-protein kinase
MKNNRTEQVTNSVQYTSLASGEETTDHSSGPKGLSGSTLNDWTAEAEVNFPLRFGPYELLNEIARGGMGVVFKARQSGLDRIVALKMILGDPGRGNHTARFIEEARAIAVLDHPNVVPIFDIGEIDGRMYFTMPFVTGASLSAVVTEKGKPTLKQALSWFEQIVAGVACAHKAGIIHRDLKPSNILLDADGRPRVADFGLAKRSHDANRAEMTNNGQLLGTPLYMSPEQARDGKEVTASTDVYALGGILYCLLTGHAPFRSDSVPDLLIKVVSEPPVPPQQLALEIPADLSELCLKCLAKAPTDRYPDAVALSESLAKITARYSGLSERASIPISELAGKSTVNYSHPDSHEHKPTQSRSAWPFALVGLVLLSLGGIATALLWKPTTPPVQETAKGTETSTPAQVPKLDPTPKLTDPPAIPATPPVVDGRTWPEPKADFRLNLQLRSEKATTVNNITELPNKSRLELQIRPEHDCWVYVFVVDTAENAVLLFPNRHEPNGKLLGGVTRVIPSDPQYALETEPTTGPGVERIRVIASSQPLPQLPSSEAVGNFQQFANDVQKRELNRAVRALRGIKMVEVKSEKPKDARFAEAEIQFRVK